MPAPAATARATCATLLEGARSLRVTIQGKFLWSPWRAGILPTVEAMERDFTALARKHGILLMLQFGSSVRGQTHARSDVDIAVLLERSPVSFREHAELLHDLQALFPEREVDLALINHADPLFLKKITDDCQILYGHVERLHRLKIYAFKRYQDHRKYFEMERQFAARFLATARSTE